MEDGDPSLPVYTEEHPGIQDSVQQLVDSIGDLDLPVTCWPCNRQSPVRNSTLSVYAEEERQREVLKAKQDIVNSFFDAVQNRNQDIVAVMIEHGLVTPDTTDSTGCSPLIRAIAADNIRMVQCLVDFGALIDRFAIFEHAKRTPLQVAALRGNLALVRLFIEVFHADDSLVAPDGEIALRLAARSGHCDIVKYLPARRGGGWQRWKIHHTKAIRRITKALNNIVFFFKIVLWYIPRFLVWDVPKHCIILPFKALSLWTWKNRHKFPAWCKTQLVELPNRIKRAILHTKDLIKQIPQALKNLWTDSVYFLTERLPKAIEKVGVWLLEGLKSMGTSISFVIQRIGSFLHTVWAAVMSFFREITLKDIWNGLRNALRAVFVDFSTKLWMWIAKLPDLSYRTLKTLFGFVGEVVYWFGYIVFHIITYVPEQAWYILKALGQSTSKGLRELRVWISPKTMT